MTHRLLAFLSPFLMIKQKLIGLVLMLLSISAVGQTPDLLGWAGIELKRDYRKGFDLSVQAQTRFQNNIQQFRGNYFSVSPSYKLKKNLALEGEVRYATSKDWDKFRFGIGLDGDKEIGKIDFGLKLRYQREIYLQAWPEIGQNPAKNNFRLKLSGEYKITKKLDFGLSIEPLYAVEARVAGIKWIRNTAKLDWEFVKRHRFEFAYFYQPTFDGLVVDQNHALVVNYAWELPKQKKKKNRKGNQN